MTRATGIIYSCAMLLKWVCAFKLTGAVRGHSVFENAAAVDSNKKLCYDWGEVGQVRNLSE